jgi:hypothetical protein
MNAYLVTGLQTNADNDRRWLHETVEAPSHQAAADLFVVDGWMWQHCESCRLSKETLKKMNPMTCSDCGKRAKKHNEPTLSEGGFLDQVVYCSCGWCGVNSVALTDCEIREYKANIKPKQMRLL